MKKFNFTLEHFLGLNLIACFMSIITYAVINNTFTFSIMAILILIESVAAIFIEDDSENRNNK